MSADRFKWLEFGDDDEKRPADATTPRPGREPDSGKDERWHLAEAEREFLNGEYEPALRNFSAALKYRPELEEAWAGQVRCMVILGQLQQALTWGKKGAEKLPTSPMVASVLAYVMAHGGDPEQGLSISDQIMSKFGEVVQTAPWFWIERGACLVNSGQQQTASSCFERAMALEKDDPDLLQRIGLEYLLGNEPARALTAFNKALEKRTDRAYLWLLTGQAAMKLNLAPRAAEALKQAVALDPTNREAREAQQKLAKAAAARPCWIATMVFEHPDHAVVAALRTWRDGVWMQNSLGRSAAWLYHVTAPLICLLLARCVILHEPLRRILCRLVIHLRLMQAAPSARVRLKEKRRCR